MAWPAKIFVPPCSSNTLDTVSATKSTPAASENPELCNQEGLQIRKFYESVVFSGNSDRNNVEGDSGWTQEATYKEKIIERPVFQESFAIAPGNVGYKMMVKSGWDGDSGLGPEGKGRRFPLKTVPKMDRGGVGCPKNETQRQKTKLKVAKEVKVSKAERRRKELIARQKEINFRRQFAYEEYVNMARDPHQVIEYLREVEETAEKILTDRQQIVNLDRTRNLTREGLRALTNEMKRGNTGKKSWVCMGNLFLKLEKELAKDFMEKDGQTLNEEIESLRRNLHKNVNRLQEIEGKPELRGFGLKPLSSEEMNAVKHTMNVK